MQICIMKLYNIYYTTNDNVHCWRHVDNWFIMDIFFQLLTINTLTH